jgi:hypothetical protein
MGKGDSRGKKKKLDLPKLAPIGRKQKKKQGRARMGEIKQEREDQAKSTVLTARERQIGVTGAAVNNPAYEDAAGAVLVLSEGERVGGELNETYRACTGAYERYSRVCNGLTPHAKTSKLEMLPEKLETSADEPPPDLRDEAERHRAAANRWDVWKSRMDEIGIGHSSAIWSAFYGWSALLHDAGSVTPAGKRFVDSVKALHEVCKKS